MAWINQQALHWWMWENRSGPNCRIVLSELAPIMGVSVEALRTALVRLCEAGRIRQLARRHTYKVTDPADWVDDD